MKKKEENKKRKRKPKRVRSVTLKLLLGKYELPLWQSLILFPLAVVRDILFLILDIIKLIILLGLLSGIIVTFILYDKYYPVYEEYSAVAKEMVWESSHETFRLTESSYIYDSEGKVISKLKANEDSFYIHYTDIPEDVTDAFVAIEDRTFWENPGIDIQGIARVCIDAVRTKGDELHGASTITQQLARNIFLTHEVSLERKAKEILLALEMTKKYSKEDIMEFYVNDICFANAYYGIGAAAKGYFNKSVDELTLSEICYLAAIPNSPSYYDPYKYPERAVTRRNKILRDMRELGYITQSEYYKALNQEIVITRSKIDMYNYETTYAIDCAVKYLMKLNEFDFRYSFATMADYNDYLSKYQTAYNESKDMLYNGGYSIYTSLNTTKQKELQSILDDGLKSFKTTNSATGIYDVQGAITVINNNTHKVEAIIGGRNQELESTTDTYTLNRAFQSPRQPGSAIKPLIVFTPQFERGYTPSTLVKNIDVSAAKQKGVIVSDLNGESMTVTRAVEWSKNGAAMWLFDKLTPAVGLSYLTNMKFQTVLPDDYYNSASLGGFTKGVTTVEMASAYSTLENHGYYTEADCLVKILDRYENNIYKDPNTKKVYEVYAADTMIEVMEGVISKGTAASLKWSKATDMDASGKTGTTNDNKDGWFCGVTPEYSIAVWIGRDDSKPVANLMGSTYPAKIWKEAMLYMIEGLEPSEFEKLEYSLGSNKLVDEESGYYSYLEGRDDNEILSGNYTVRDYRIDRVNGEKIDDILRQMSEDMGNVNVPILQAEAQNMINNLMSQKYRREKQSQLDTLMATGQLAVVETDESEDPETPMG